MNLKRFALTAVFALYSAHASAGYISVQSEPSVFLENNSVLAVITLTNLGDEPAYNLSMRAACSDLEGFSETIADLQPDQSATLKSIIGTPPTPGGIYTVVFEIYYTDSGGTSYSALNAISLVTELETPPRDSVKVATKNIALDKRSKITAEIAVAGPVQNHTLSLFLPNEIRCRQRTVSVSQNDSSVSYEIRNRSAHPGSTYLAILVSDYVENGMHLSKATPLNIRVTSAASASQSPILMSLLASLIVLALTLQFRPVRQRIRVRALKYLEAGIILAALCALEIFLISNLQPKYLLMNTTTVGGDTPAHNYIASHLRDSLLGEGRVISWAGGWWCGFPMFQFYFSLPYILMALLDLILPFNIAFKLISIAGILILPIAAWTSGRIMRLPKPIPLVAALFTIPILFDQSHTMWGVNIYSTLAGMISNSMSFPIMLLFLGSMWRDAEDQRFRVLTVLLLAAVLASHFFTSIVGLMTAAIIPFLRPRRDISKVALILGAEVALAITLMSWWIVPLIFKMQYTADFGTNWPDIVFFKQLPSFAKALSPCLIPAAAMLFLKRTRIVILFMWMLAISILLFFFGFTFSSVFVNVRLWPFILFALVMLEAIGAGYILSLLPFSRVAIIPLTGIVLLFAIDAPNNVPGWAKWNFEGLESKSNYAVFEKLVLPLKGTPGRLANDLCDENNMLGSSRIFELAPHLAGKPILEGGIVNSAAGSMFSYYIQGETSRNCAGFPSNVKPTSFNITNATKHLELFNVKHFIARWDTTRNAMHEHKDWRYIGREDQWELFELMSHDGSYVVTPDYMPIAIEMQPEVMDWKTAGLEWIYNISSINNHFIILPHGTHAPEGMTTIDARRYLDIMAQKDIGPINALAPSKLPDAQIVVLQYTDSIIEFTTTKPGIPHIIKTTWYPNWKAENGEQIFMITPCFMMIVPTNSHVRICYGRTASDTAGLSLSAAGLILLLAISSRSLLNKRTSS